MTSPTPAEVNNEANENEKRVLLVPPTRRDGEVTIALLAQAGLRGVVCRDLIGLSQEIAAGAGAILMTEQALAATGIERLIETLEAQPPWSQLPVVLLIERGARSTVAQEVLEALRNVMLLERPAPTRSVVSALLAAVRGRERQYLIRDQIEALRRINHMKDEFLATVSHELRTPLNAIFGWTQILRTDTCDPQTLREGIAVIDRNVRIQVRLINDLLDVSRIISGKVRLDVQPVELSEVLHGTLETVRPAAEAKQLILEKIIDPLAGPVSGDPGRLQQVFWNLLTNAIKFTPKGGRIQVLTERVNSHVEISVSDSGEGISPDFLPRLFDRFSQADGSSKRKHGGLGLGLSIVKSLVELHGGSVLAKSAGQGLGATFVVRLPLRVARTAARELPRQGTAAASAALDCHDLRLHGLKVLVVDDEPDARDLVERFLVECGATPAVAASAAEAQTLLSTFQPDVIVSDIGMPEQDGYDFIREVRNQGYKTPAVALTAFARAEDRIRTIQSGYQTHLPKPVEPAELMAVVASLAGRFDGPHEK